MQSTRREFIKTSTLAGAALAGFGASKTLAGNEDETGPASSTTLPVTLAGYDYDRVKALNHGKVEVEGVELHYEPSNIYALNRNAMGGAQKWDVQEIGLHPYMLAYANETFRDYTLIPVFPLRTFRHKSMFIRTDRGIEKPQDLRGKRIATPGYSQSSLTWIRGILKDEYQVLPEEMLWVISESSDKGKSSKNELRVPSGVPVEKGPAGKNEAELLLGGEVDAAFVAIEPKAFMERESKVRRLFSDYRQAEGEYFQKTGIFPIMHVVAIKQEVAQEHPWLPLRMCKAYTQAKQIMYQELNKLGWAMISLPWVGQEIERTRRLMGENFWPYGIPANRKALEALFRYSHEQGLASRELKIDELFHPSTLEYEEKFD